ncbi:MAG: exopolysaccharide biosynthesis protein [Hyphomicrobiales bacterium]
MAQEHIPQNLTGLLDQLKSAGRSQETLTVADIRERLGRRSFGPLLLFSGLILLTPLAGLPVLPGFFGLVIMLTAGQMLLGWRELWLPDFVLRRSFTRHNVERFDATARRIARYVDRFVRPRWPYLTEPPLPLLIAVLCFLMGLLLLPLEFIPFTSSIPGLPVAAFGLALMTRDGLFVVVGLAATAAIIGAIAGATIVVGEALV